MGTSSLTVVDATSHSVVANVTLPVNNTGGLVNAGLAIDDSARTVYASVQGEVVEVNGSTNSIEGELHLPLRTLAFDSDTNELWGTTIQDLGGFGQQNGSLVGVDARTGAVVANVSIGFSPYDIAVDAGTGMVYADGCDTIGLVCNSRAAIVDGTRGTLVAMVNLNSGDYPTMTLDPATHVLYVSGGQQLAAINGKTGNVIFTVDPQTCGPFTGMVVDPSANLVYTAQENSNYLLAYDGTTGKLVNMYYFESIVGPVAFNPKTSELYAYTAGDLIAFTPLLSTGNVNSTLVAPHGFCPAP